MGRRPDYVYQQNALRGALKRQCPKCGRKAALRTPIIGGTPQQGMTTIRQCRWCDFHEERTTYLGLRQPVVRRLDLGE